MLMALALAETLKAQRVVKRVAGRILVVGEELVEEGVSGNDRSLKVL